MASQTNNLGEMQQEQEGKIVSKRGLRVGKYNVPWWIVIAVLIVVIYIVYDHCHKKEHILMKGGSFRMNENIRNMEEMIRTPDFLRDIFNNIE